ncbi:MAG: GTP-binding protein [Desulfobacterales bacterium]|nr:GTP-binding protein [Desulfobacterales bacterium]
MIIKKVCMLGGYGVGKTSLVSNFVHSIFSEKYQITLGVKIDKKTVEFNGRDVKLMLWDIAGEEEKFSIPPTYLKGSEGYLLVIDGTRKGSYEQALDIHTRVEETLGQIPFIAVVNKSDLAEDWELGRDIMDEMADRGWQVIKSSAKSGTGVEESFTALVEKMLS